MSACPFAKKLQDCRQTPGQLQAVARAGSTFRGPKLNPANIPNNPKGILK
jgi:hypothetical protein